MNNLIKKISENINQSLEEKGKSSQYLPDMQKIGNAVKKTIFLRNRGYNKNCIYIKSDDYVFDKKAYRPEVLGKYLSQREYETIINELNKVVTKAFIKNNKHEKVKIYRFIYFLILISMLFFIAGSVLLEEAHKFHNSTPDELNLYYVLAILFFLAVVGFFLGLTIHNYQHTSIQITTMEETIHSYIKQYVSFLNVYFQGVFQWNYISNKGLIELNIVNIEDDEDEIGKLSRLNKENSGYYDKRRKCEELKKIEEVFEANGNEEDEMIQKKLYGNGWIQNNNKIDLNYYINEEEEEEEDDINEEEKKKEVNNEKEKENSDSDVNLFVTQGSMIKSSQMVSTTDNNEEINQNNIKLITQCEENVSLLDRQSLRNTNDCIQIYLHPRSLSYS